MPLIRLPVTPFSTDKIKQFRRQENHTNPTGPLRLFAGGNMEGRKGLSLAIRALDLVSKEGVDFHYTIAGGGPDIPAMRALVSQLGLENKVEFHPGFHGNDYIRALHSTDVYFLPSFRETMGMTLVEAIYAGCYPIVADTSAQGEIVRLAGGKAVAATNQNEMIHGLAQAVLWCDSNRENFPSETAKAIERIAEYFSAERHQRVIEEAYQKTTIVQSQNNH